MTLDALKSASRVMGIKQVSKAVKRGDATCVFLADDADARVIEPLCIHKRSAVCGPFIFCILLPAMSSVRGIKVLFLRVSIKMIR